MEFNKLKDVGLNEKEIKIYVKLLDLNEATVSKIAKETNINRSLLYFILFGLEKKGFVSYFIKNNIKYYRPVEPEKILNLIEEKKKSFELILPELIDRVKLNKTRPVIEILEGKEGIKTILNEILRLKQDWFAFNVPGMGPKILGDWVHSYEKERQKLGIKLKVLMVESEQGLERGREFSKMKNTRVKYLGKNYESPSSNYIYSDRLVIIFWYPEFPFAIRIIDSNLVKSYKKYFNEMWKIARR